MKRSWRAQALLREFHTLDNFELMEFFFTVEILRRPSSDRSFSCLVREMRIRFDNLQDIYSSGII